MREYSSLGKAFEIFIFFLILIAILETFGEEFAVYMNYSAFIRKLLLVAGCAFDLIFTIEFIARLFASGRRWGTGAYFLSEGGIIDFISSFPLLLFSSGPLVYMTFFADERALIISLGSLTFLKIVKVMRIARIFRFMRTLKVFGKVRRRYIMTPGIIAIVLTITISISVGSLAGFTYLENGQLIRSESAVLRNIVHTYLDKGDLKGLLNVLEGTDAVLFIKRGDEMLYSGVGESFFQKNFFHDDFLTDNFIGYTIYLNNKDAKQAYALIHIMVFSLILGILIGTVTIFRFIFNKHVASVIMVMLRGFQSGTYSTPVRIIRSRENHEIYRLADQYNRKWLPIKRRIIELKQRKR